MCKTGSRLVEAVNLRKLWEEADKKARDWREAGEEKLLRQAFDAREGLKHCGWFDGRHAPKDGTRFLVCGWDSTGVFPCRWQMGHFMVENGGDLWPVSSVGMWKPMPSNANVTGPCAAKGQRMNHEPLPAQGPVDVNVGRRTPGPWRLDVRGGCAGIKAGPESIIPGMGEDYPEDLIAYSKRGAAFDGVYWGLPDETISNMRLMAAAPDLLEALQELRYARTDKAEEMADAAIAKALDMTPNAEVTDSVAHGG